MFMLLIAFVFGIVAVIATVLIDIIQVENLIAKFIIYFLFFFTAHLIIGRVERRKS
ncbi:hypothetical protein GCM10008986_12770 [Salinibacillus aidingensis]|uniref:Uncharacterized protein n=1 Tax=Salinibacillus aidingensis TaxID=237684 RepID=A0ABN1B1P5_9BACI